MVDSVDWDARRRNAVIVVDGFDVLQGKTGWGVIDQRVWASPGMGEFLSAVVDAAMAETDDAKRNAAIVAALKAGLAKLSAKNGSTPGQIALAVAPQILPTLLDLFAKDTVLASEDERPAYRAWLNTLDGKGLLDCLSGWIKLNFPRAHGPFVLWAGKGLFRVQELLDALGAKAGAGAESEMKPSPEPRPPVELIATEASPSLSPSAA